MTAPVQSLQCALPLRVAPRDAVTRRVLGESWLCAHAGQAVVNGLCRFNAWFPQSKEICKSVLPSVETFTRHDVGIFSPCRAANRVRSCQLRSAPLSSRPPPLSTGERRWDAGLRTRHAFPAALPGFEAAHPKHPNAGSFPRPGACPATEDGGGCLPWQPRGRGGGGLVRVSRAAPGGQLLPACP